MKKYTLSLIVCLAVVATAFGQSKNVRKAESALEKGDLAEAKSMIDPAITDEKTKDEGKTWFIYGQVYQAIGEDSTNSVQVDSPYQTALDAYRKAKDLEKEGAVYYTFADQQIQDIWAKNVNAGAEMYQAQDFENAIQAFDVAKMAVPEDTTAYIYAGISAQQAGNLDVAAENYEYLVDELDYKSEDFYNSLIYIYLVEKKDNEKAVEYLRKAQEAYPENSDFLKREINVLINDENYDEAEQKLTKAIEAEDDNSILYYNRAYLYEQMDRDEEAITNYKKAIELDPSYFDANFNLAAFYFNKAAEVLQEANDMDLKEYQKRGKEIEGNAKAYFEQALPYLEKSKELKPDDEKVLTTLQTVYTRLGMEDKAEQLQSEMSGQ
ncbi:tetratricopeptide repeat protein [Catalinimonas niigatensis]|uniref:tetratricopeptide repeat protein n=1 Tax=Catalinimonas niigatensis TaxID=1397264 RepID=UPI002666DEC7|nr:tetratricopeptide repeat protein [Catalinimonas niigatensis]WPP50934.1 tetratricopeptide repeat protein [Catalinimonas niigatensis]